MQGGWNSTVWSVRGVDGRRYLAKLADAEASTGFRSGLRVARRAAERGFRSGPPIPLPDGSLDVTVPSGALTLLEYVQGRRAEVGSGADLRRMGGTLARAHACLAADVECLDPSLVWPARVYYRFRVVTSAVRVSVTPTSTTWAWTGWKPAGKEDDAAVAGEGTQRREVQKR
jgi:hypothetical protein